jgi:hypothetical protein
MPEPRQLLGSLLPDRVPPGSEIQASPATFRHPCTRADRQAPGRGPSGRQVGNPSPAPGRGLSAPVQRAPPRFVLSDWRPKKVSTYFWRLRWGRFHTDLSRSALNGRFKE